MYDKKIKILVAEDDETLGFVLKERLARAGFDVDYVPDGEQALNAIRKNKPDLVLLDLLMPRINGLEVIRQIMRNDKKAPAIVVLSNSGLEEEVKKALSLGAKDYYVKAEFDPDQIVKLIDKHLKKLGKPTSNKRTIHKKKVLLVEDDRLLQQLLFTELDRHSIMVEVAVDGEEALQKLTQIRPDLILLDMVLPGKNGLEVLKKIKSSSDLSNIPIVMLSNLSQETDKKQALALGAKEYIVKADKTLEEIVATVLEYIK